jgi:hypothetical protein
MIMERSTKCFCSGPQQRKKIRTRISVIRMQMKHSVKKNCVTIMKAAKQIKIISDKVISLQYIIFVPA